MTRVIQHRFSAPTARAAAQAAREFWRTRAHPEGVSWEAFCARCVTMGRGETILYVESPLARSPHRH